MWKRIEVRDDSLSAQLARELERLSPQQQAKVYGAVSSDRGVLYLNEHASDAFAEVLDQHEFVEDIDAPSDDELSTFLPLFAPRFKVS